MRDEGVPSANNFAHQIEELVHAKGVGYLDAIMLWCSGSGQEPEVAAGLVKKSAPLKIKLQLEAEDLRLLTREGGAQLPF